jgi:hypothetical protein
MSRLTDPHERLDYLIAFRAGMVASAPYKPSEAELARSREGARLKAEWREAAHLKATWLYRRPSTRRVRPSSPNRRGVVRARCRSRRESRRSTASRAGPDSGDSGPGHPGEGEGHHLGSDRRQP